METLDSIIDTLAPDSLLRALSRVQLEGLLAKSNRRELKKGDVLINQGDEEGDFAVYLLSGALKISFVSAGGREIILNYCAPNELVGEIALLDSGPRTATVTAVVPSAVLLLPTQAFLETVSNNPASVVGVMRELARRVRQLNLVVESDRTFSMGPRLARALVRLIDRNREDGELIYNPSQNDLGAFAGLARENVSRLLTEWEAQEVIERKGRALVVRDIEYLELLAEFGDDG
ncbi:Crp/Fnr family transcriptional regulator [uncultured Erythrobacter sp.]|uniref:Crp/Fnr family transcriptional regulator n=1 Tax=uncultured Erythrobacter sp. TaxID=263913 RepID=UPI00260AB12F|nr:Crp/Fnr family transcriptional regulator [uncultured Erythrobacter sp.]